MLGVGVYYLCSAYIVKSIRILHAIIQYFDVLGAWCLVHVHKASSSAEKKPD